MNYQTLERTIGHSFADIALLDLAMTHPSYALQHKCQDNQRLELLGDAVLEICVSRVLYHKYPKLREGQLTRKRAALVCEANLARAATRVGWAATSSSTGARRSSAGAKTRPSSPIRWRR